jgi:hypothetical protein
MDKTTAAETADQVEMERFTMGCASLKSGPEDSLARAEGALEVLHGNAREGW